MSDTSEERMKTQDADLARRNFLRSCGKFAVVTPPAMAMLLSTSLSSPAVAVSGAGNGNGLSSGGEGGDCSFVCRFFRGAF